MKKGMFLFISILAVAALSAMTASAAGRHQSWAEWNFSTPFSGDELKADTASGQGTLLRLNIPGSTVFSISGGLLACSGTADLGEFLQMDINDLEANGGGTMVNEHTWIFDIRTDSTPDRIGLFNADTANADDAELWLAGDGSAGSSGIFSPAGGVPPQTWTRLIVSYETNAAGEIVENIYIDGACVLAGTVRGVLDGSFSLSPDAQQPASQAALFGANDQGVMRLDAFELMNFGFLSRALSAEEIGWLGAADPKGIGLGKLRDPRLDIMCNGEDSGVIVPQGGNATVTYKLAPRAATGYTAEVWVVLGTPFGLFSYDGLGPFSGWNFGLGKAAYAGPLMDMTDTVLDRPLPLGAYTAYLAFDWIVNGKIDPSYLFGWDAVDFSVQ